MTGGGGKRGGTCIITPGNTQSDCVSGACLLEVPLSWIQGGSRGYDGVGVSVGGEGAHVLLHQGTHSLIVCQEQAS